MATRNGISDHPSPNLRKTLPAIAVLPAIPIIPAPVIRNVPSPMSAVEVAVPTYDQHHSSQKKSKKAERQTGNALAAAAETT